MATIRPDRNLIDDSATASLPPLRIYFFGIGAGLIILACLASGHLIFASMVSTFILAIVLMLGAILQFTQAIGMRRTVTGRLWALSGLFYLLAGLAVLVEPLADTKMLMLVVALMLVISGVSRLVIGIQRNANWILVSGTATILAGTVIGMDWPQNSLWGISLLIIADLLAQGLALVFTGASHRLRG